jgi:hypothetical protein
MHRHDVGACELAIGGSSSTVAVATRQEEQRRRVDATGLVAAEGAVARRIRSTMLGARVALEPFVTAHEMIARRDWRRASSATSCSNAVTTAA